MARSRPSVALFVFAERFKVAGTVLVRQQNLLPRYNMLMS